MKSVLAALILLAQLTLPAYADLFVSSSGSSSSACTSGAPCTIARANAIVTPGTIVHVASCPGSSPCYLGTFNISTSGASGQRITWISDTPRGAKVDGVFNVYGSFVTMQNFDCQDTATADDCFTTEFNSATPIYGQFVWILNNYVHDVKFSTNPNGSCPGGEGNSGILIGAASHDFIVDSNVINNNGHWGGCSADGGSSAHGIYVTGFHGTVTNNQVSNSAGYGIELYHNPCQNVVANNTVFHNFTGGIQLAGAPGSGAGTGGPGPGFQCGTDDFDSVNNNLIVGNGFGVAAPGAAHTHAGLVYSSGTGTNNKAFANLLAGNLDENGAASNSIRVAGGVAPAQGSALSQTATAGIFVNYQSDGSGNYTLVTGSPAIGNGTLGTGNCAVLPGISPCIPTADILGNAFSGQIGAYAFASAPPPPSPPGAPTGLTIVVH